MRYLVVAGTCRDRIGNSTKFSDLIRNISDPEHPLSLEELRVVEEKLIKVRIVCSESILRENMAGNRCS